MKTLLLLGFWVSQNVREKTGEEMEEGRGRGEEGFFFLFLLFCGFLGGRGFG